jgi:hypothetical protein
MRLFHEARKFLRGEVSPLKSFWLWGIAGNLAYISFFMLWNGGIVDALRRSDFLGWLFLLAFWITSAGYMVFSYLGGIRSANNHPDAAAAAESYKIIAALLLIMGILLWLYFSFFFLLDTLGMISDFSDGRLRWYIKP